MHKKKLICLAFAALLPMGSVVAEEPAAVQPVAVESPESEAVQGEAVESESTAGKETVDRAADSRLSMEERQKEREKRYEELKKRAEEAGVMLPESPPWRDREAMIKAHPEMQKRMEHMQEMQAMTPEERDAYRKERYQEMQERSKETGLEMPETSPWEQRQTEMQEEWLKHQEVIKGMSDEERAACHAMHRRHMSQAGPGPMMHEGMRQGGPGPMMQERGMYPTPMFQGRLPGYGYGPGPYGPRGNFWGPNQ